MFQRFISSPFFFRISSGLLRIFFPVLKVGQWVIISRFDDVKEVLVRDSEFTIAEINAARMNEVGIDFFLGMDRSERLEREKGVMEKIMGRDDLPNIQKLIAAKSNAIISTVKNTMEVVSVLSRVVPLTLIEEYFGVPVNDKATMQRWMRKLFHQLFLNLNNDVAVANEAKVAAAELASYMNNVISGQQKLMAEGQSVPDTLLTRLLRLQATHSFVDTDFIRRNLSGLMIGTVDTTSKCVVLVLEELLRRPQELEAARKVALRDDITMLKNYCYEALRFNPHNPIVVRHSSKELTLGTNKKYRIPANRKIAAGIFSAMHDKAVFSKPGTFDPNRGNEYLHFGYGLHACFGRYINAIQIPQIVAVVLKRKNVRQSPGKKIIYDGPFPDQYWLDLDAE